MGTFGFWELLSLGLVLYVAALLLVGVAVWLLNRERRR